MERHGRRIPSLRRGRRIGWSVVALLQVVSAVGASAENVPGPNLHPTQRELALEERGCGEPTSAQPRCSDLAVTLGRQAGRRFHTFNDVVVDLPSKLRTDCDVKPEDVGWPTSWIRCFDAADTEQSEWLTQGIGGTGEWRTAETPGGGQHYLVATWCWRGSEGIDEADICNREEPIKRTRVSVISVERGAYRNVELVEPYVRQVPGRRPTVASRGILLHAGGAAIAGRWLYVADTDWLYVFNLNHFLQDGNGPYQLPVWTRYVIANPADRDRDNPFSSISVDGSGDTPRLVAAEYRLNRRDDALVTTWPLDQTGRLGAAKSTVRSTAAYIIDGDSEIDRVQGVAAHGETFLFTESSDTLERARPGANREAADRCIKWGDGNGEDLYASPSQDVIVGINEGFLARGSTFWAVPYRPVFGLTPPPPGSPARDC